VLAETARGPLLDDHLFKLFISATIVTLFLTPYLVSGAPRAGAGIIVGLQRLRLLGPSQLTPPSGEANAKPRLLIIGYGPTGQIVARSAARMGERPVVIDLNPKAVRAAAHEGLHAQLGDATHAEVLEHAGVRSADVAIVTVPDTDACHAVAARISALSPSTHVIARARYNRSHRELATVADEVIDEEMSVALRISARMRARVRAAQAADDSRTES